MSKTKILQEMQVMRFEKVYKLRTERKLTVSEITKMLSAHERTPRCWTKRYKTNGMGGLRIVVSINLFIIQCQLTKC